MDVYENFIDGFLRGMDCFTNKGGTLGESAKLRARARCSDDTISYKVGEAAGFSTSAASFLTIPTTLAVVEEGLGYKIDHEIRG